MQLLDVKRYGRLTLLTLIIFVGVMLYVFNPTKYWFWPKCPIKLLTGLSCPACGIQRFVHDIANGHLAAAISYNYYLIYALPYAAIIAGIYIMPQSTTKERLTDIFQSKAAIWLYVISFCIWFVIRNILNI